MHEQPLEAACLQIVDHAPRGAIVGQRGGEGGGQGEALGRGTCKRKRGKGGKSA